MGAKKENVVFAQMHDEENMRWLWAIMAETNQPMREVVEHCIEHCRKSKRFKMPVRVTTAEKLAIAQKEREERLRARIAGDQVETHRDELENGPSSEPATE